MQGGRGHGADITPEHPAESKSRHGRKRAVITPRPRMVGLSGRLARQREWYRRGRFTATLSLDETKALFILADSTILSLRTSPQTGVAIRRGVKKTCRWHVFSLRSRRLCRRSIYLGFLRTFKSTDSHASDIGHWLGMTEKSGNQKSNFFT